MTDDQIARLTALADAYDDDFADDDGGFECAAYWTGSDWHCPLAGSEECDWECTETFDGEAPINTPVAALYVAADGCYFNLPGVDPWDEARDARLYDGPHPVVAHPPCQRWGRFWHGSTRKPHQYRLGADAGCFAAALTAVRNFGGVLEHPKDSEAWGWFGLMEPTTGGWQRADNFGGWTCCVDQGHYGHFANKRSWLYAVGCELPSLDWRRGEQRIHPRALELHGYEKARRIGMMAMVGGKDKTATRNATPHEFRDLLIGMARSVSDGALGRQGKAADEATGERSSTGGIDQ